MYIIYNSDGSIEKKSITEYIQQGNSYANVLFVTVKDTDLGDYTASAIVTLPNGQNVGAIVEEAEEPVEIDGVEYNGYYITLDETCTLMAGAIRISLSLTIDETRMVTYPIYLNVNATPYDADAPVMISYNQYLELLASIAEVTTPNNPTITLQKNGVTVGYFSLNQASNKTINYVLSKSDVGLGNVDNTSDATKKSNFTGSIAENNTGFATGGAVYSALHGTFTYDLTFGYNNGICLKDQSNNEYKIYANNYGLKLGTNVTITNDGDITAVGYLLAGYRISAADNVLRIRHYILDSNNGTAKFYHENSGLGNSEGAADLGTTDNPWNCLYANKVKPNELEFAKTPTGSYQRKYVFKVDDDGYLTINDTRFYNMGIGMYAHQLTFDGGWTLFGNSDNGFFTIGNGYRFVKTQNSEAFYHLVGTFSGTTYNAADLGTSDYKWKDLYLSGKINGINVPTDTIPNDTFAVESEISKFLLDTTTTIADVKALMTVTDRDKFFVYSQANGWQDKTAEIIAGDYDSVTVINNKFESFAKEITIGQVGSRYLLLKHEKYNYWYMVEDYASQPVTKTLIVVTNGTYPSRKNLCRVDAISYKHHLGVVIQTSLTIEFDVIDRDENAITKDNFISRVYTSHVNSILVTIIDNRTSHGYGAVMLGKLTPATVGLYGAIVNATDGSTYNVLETPLTPANFSQVVDTKTEL